MEGGEHFPPPTTNVSALNRDKLLLVGPMYKELDKLLLVGNYKGVDMINRDKLPRIRSCL